MNTATWKARFEAMQAARAKFPNETKAFEASLSKWWKKHDRCTNLERELAAVQLKALELWAEMIKLEEALPEEAAKAFCLYRKESRP